MDPISLSFSTPALLWSVRIAAVATLVCWGLQTLFTNYSWVDRLWSIMPPVYAWVFVVCTRPLHARLLLMAALATVWGARLTFNFARKGGYHPLEEDYRWGTVRAWLTAHDPTHPLGRELFSLLFIAIYQHLLIASFCVPALAFVASSSARRPLTALDAVAASAFLGFLALETLTDQQQWRFQRQKHRMTLEERTLAGGDFARGFLTRGAFRFSRHLNFFCEASLWWAFALFPIAAGAPGLNGMLVGPLLLTLLFQGSTWLTERISVAKYPEYRRYQKTTSRLIPWRTGPSLEVVPVRPEHCQPRVDT